jgi:hypothetical protein
LFDDLEPDPTAVANQGAGLPAQQIEDLALRYSVPLETAAFLRQQLSLRQDPLDARTELLLLNNLARNALGGQGPFFENLSEEGRVGAEQMIRDEIGRRAAQANQVEAGEQAQLPAPVEPARNQMAERNPVPRNIRTMAIGNLINDMSPAWNRQAQELAETYFNDNVIDGPNISIGSLTGMLRDYRIGPHAEAPAEVRELAARRLENLHAEAEGNAEQLADSLNEAFYIDLDPQEAMSQIDRDISSLERNGELAWEDLVGPMAEDIPWNRNVQHHLLGYLRALADQYADLRRAEDPDGFAKGGMVKKKRRAKKDGMPLILTRKSPELTELAYQYGGMVG